MIDRGALVLAQPAEGAYRGTARTPLDGVPVRGRRGRELVRRYRAAVVAGDGVVEDLDEAIALRDEARAMGLAAVEVVVFEAPAAAGPSASLELWVEPPAEGMRLLGWDVIELLEPWSSALGGHCREPVNAAGLLATRREAEALAARMEREAPADAPWVAVRIWSVP